MADEVAVRVTAHVRRDVNAVPGGGAEDLANGPHIAGGGRPILVIVGGDVDGKEAVGVIGIELGTADGFLGRGNKKTRLRSVTRPDGN
jgi:hypothetical protein